MNEIGLTQVIPDKTRSSAPERSASSLKNNSDAKASLVSQAEESQTKQDDISAQQVASDEKIDLSSVENAVAKLNDYVQNSERKLEFQIDDDSGETIVRVYDKSSEELIRQIPNEEALELAQKLNQEEPLMLFSAQV